VLTIQGGWLDLDSRMLIAPPAQLTAVLVSLPRMRTYEELPSLLRRRS
jgi:hypothetical protein